MSIVCAAIKNGKIAIACDTQVSHGSLKVTDVYLEHSSKLYKVNGNIIGLVGWGGYGEFHGTFDECFS